MEIYRIGARIKEERIRQKLSQEDLCYGICAVSTLSRIETGIQKPSLKVEEALLERLGCSTENLVFFANEDEIIKHSLEMDIGAKLMHHNMNIKAEMKEYEKQIAEQGAASNLEKQYYMMVKAAYNSYVEGMPLKGYEMLKTALLLTMPNFRARDLYTIRLMTMTEINILNNMAVALYEMNRIGLSMKYMYFLVDYIERSKLNKEVIMKRYPMLLVNLAMLETKIGDYRQAFFLCRKGIHFCKTYGRLVPLAEFYYYRAVAYAKLGGMRKALESYEYAICLFKVSSNEELAEQVKEEYENVIKYSKCTKEYLHAQQEGKDLLQLSEEQRRKSDLPV